MGLLGLSSASQGLDLQGHRGARGLMPENTLPAFAKALSIGVTTLELDVVVTKDFQVIVIHNPRLEPAITRNSQGDWLAKASPSLLSMTLDNVKTYDVGRINPDSSYIKRFPGQQPLDGISIPTLAEVFELVNKSGNTQVKFNIEVKINPEHPERTLPPKEFVQTVLEQIRLYEMENRVTLQSFDWRALAVVQTLAPEITTAYLTADQPWLSNLQTEKPGVSAWLAGFDIDSFDGNAARAIKAAGGDIWSSYHKEVSAEAIKSAQALGLSVNVWTVNEPERMRALIDMGIDGIITDYPDRLRQVMVDLELELPVPTPIDY